MNKHIRIPVNPDGAATTDHTISISAVSPAETNDGNSVAADQTIRQMGSKGILSDWQPTRGKRKRAAADPATGCMKTNTTLQDRRQFDVRKSDDYLVGSDVDRCDHNDIETQTIDVASDQPNGAQKVPATHLFSGAAGDDAGQCGYETQVTPAPVIAEIIQLWRMRQRWHRAEKSLILQGKAICRAFLAVDDLHHENEKIRTKARDAVKARASKIFDEARDGKDVDQTITFAVMPFITSIERTFAPERAALEKRLKKLARQLPIWDAWAKAVPGFAELSLAAIVGEAGDLSGYSNPAKLWKRMGLAVIKGERQRKKAGAEEALEHGYNPSRRSVMWNIGGGLIGGMGHDPRPRIGEDVTSRDDLSDFQKMFVRFIREEVSKVTPTWNGLEHARDPVERKGEIFESYSAHAAARAKRRVEKEFLVRLLMAWRAAGQCIHVDQTGSAGSPTLSGSDAGVARPNTDEAQGDTAGDELISGED
jgi:hypothetical protein